MSGTIVCAGNFELPDRNAAAHRVVNNARLFRSFGLETVFQGTTRTEEYFEGPRKTDNDFGFDMYERCYPRSTAQWAAQIFDVGDLKALVSAYPETAAVILYNTQYSTLLAAKKAFKPLGIKVIYDCTEWNSFTEGSALKRAVKTLDSRLIENRLTHACDGVIAVSSTMAKKYGDKKPLIVLPPLVDLSDGIWRQPKLEHERFTFCYAGSPSDKDRLDILLDAFSGLDKNETELLIIGVSREEYGSGSVPSNVTLLGRLSHEETVRQILSCGCFVFLREPTRRNTAGFPTKFVEAFTCGVPIITTNVSDIADYADDSCVLLDDISVRSVRDALLSATKIPSCAALRTAFDIGSRKGDCREWFERITCREE